jgi:hypothetical protein
MFSSAHEEELAQHVIRTSVDEILLKVQGVGRERKCIEGIEKKSIKLPVHLQKRGF